MDESCTVVDRDSIALPKGMRIFAMRVRGSAMVSAGILDNDTIILEFRSAHHGDIVAALVDGDAVLRRYVMRGGRPFLQTDNPQVRQWRDMIPAHELVIQGVMVALVRNVKHSI